MVPHTAPTERLGTILRERHPSLFRSSKTKSNAQQISRFLGKNLPNFGRSIAEAYQRLPPERLQHFLDHMEERSGDADHFAQHIDTHDPTHHQFGITDHSRLFTRVMTRDLDPYLAKWRLKGKVDKHLSQRIDGMSKRELITIASQVHDLGKYAKGEKYRDVSGERIDDWKRAARTTPDFKAHGEISEEIIRSPGFSEILKARGLTESQIDYVARCAGVHFQLGDVRKAVEREGYTMEFPESPKFRAAFDDIVKRDPDYAPETVLMFLADSLAKDSLRSRGKADEVMTGAERRRIETRIKSRGLHPKLLRSIEGNPVNIAVARKGLEILFK